MSKTFRISEVDYAFKPLKFHVTSVLRSNELNKNKTKREHTNQIVIMYCYYIKFNESCVEITKAVSDVIC